LSSQFPLPPIRVVFAKAGLWPAACIVRDRRGIIDHKLYWEDIPSEDEARFLIAILNSEAARIRIAHLQSRGEQGARDFDKLMFTLPIPRFDPREAVHAGLAAEGAVAEEVAAAVALPMGASFQKARALVRDALREEGVSARIDALVETLLGPDPRLALPDDEAVPARDEEETIDA
jgi:hypothetical protein